MEHAHRFARGLSTTPRSEQIVQRDAARAGTPRRGTPAYSAPRSDTAARHRQLDLAIRENAGYHRVNVKNMDRVLVCPRSLQNTSNRHQCRPSHQLFYPLEVMLDGVLPSYTQAILSVLSVYYSFRNLMARQSAAAACKIWSPLEPDESDPGSETLNIFIAPNVFRCTEPPR